MLTGLAATAAKALEKSLTVAFAQVGKRLWTQRISPSARRERAAADIVRQLTSHDFTGQLRLTAVLPELSTGISLAQVKASLGGAGYQGLLHELIAARLMSMPDHVVQRVRENMQIVTRLEFRQADADSMAAFGGVLFDELDRVIQALVAKLTGTHAQGLDALRETAHLTLLSAGADGITHHNSHLKRPETFADASARADWEATYRQQVTFYHGHIEPPDFERKRKVPIESLFVSPEITSRPRDETSQVADVWTLYDAIDRTVLLGDPGGGKSTASNVIACHATKDPADLIPFVVILRTFADHDISILDHIETRLSVHYQCAPPPFTVEGLLLSGRAVVIFDGLDELIDTSKRREVTDRVELFSRRYPSSRILVTSRRVGYDEAALDPDIFSTYELADFSDDNVAKYVRNWFLHVGGADEKSVQALADSFVEESAAVSDLRRNPLMLALMCIIYRGQQWIPRNRPDMYEYCANLLFEKWDDSRKIYVELKAKAHVDAAIKHLALWMFTESAGAQGVTEVDLIREAATFLRPVFNSATEAESAAKQFVGFCRGRAWVLSEAGTTADGTSLFAFTHRTFLEYFAAYELTRRHDTPEQIARKILPRVAAAEWEIVAELAVQISNKHSRDGAARILTTLLADKRYSSTTSRYNISRFALRCLSFAHTPVPLTVQIAEASANAVFRFAAEGGRAQYDNFTIIPDLLESVEKKFYAMLRSKISTGRGAEKTVAVELAMDLSGFVRGSGHSTWNPLRKALFDELGHEILTERTDMIWTSAWRCGLISLEKLVREGPRASRYPLEILFIETSNQYLPTGWSAWGPFIPERLLQSGTNSDIWPPVTVEEMEWLGEFVNELGSPPWLADTSNNRRILKFNGELIVDKMPTQYGATLFLLALIGIECKGLDNFQEPRPGTSRKYYAALDALAWRRKTGAGLPQWLADAIDTLPPDRRELTHLWLDNKVNFLVT